MERANEYVKDRMEGFNDYWLCDKVNLRHVWHWLDVFLDKQCARRRHMMFSQVVGFLSREANP